MPSLFYDGFGQVCSGDRRMKLKTIYVVEGQTGEYSDHCKWPVRAFVSEKRAKRFVEEVSQEYRKLKQRYYVDGGPAGWYFKMKDAEEQNPLDPNMQTDYTGTTYSYYPIELDEEI